MEFQVRHYQELPQYEKLEDIDLPANHIEGGIKNLVRALQVIRVDTEASCEGHLDHGHKHPWVGINPFSFAKISALKHIVKGYNQAHRIKWQVSEPPNRLLPSDEEMPYTCCGDYKGRMTKRLLKRLQESADELASYVFDHRADEEIKELILIYGL